MQTKPILPVLTAAKSLAICSTAVIGLAVAAFAQGKPAPPAQGGTAKPKAASGAIYRRLDTAKDGLDFKMSDMSLSFTNGGTTMGGDRLGGVFTDSSGHELQIKLASQTISGGQIHTVDFGIIRMKIPDATSPGVQLFLTNDQIRQIKKKMGAPASDTNASSEEFVGVLGDSARRLDEEPVKLSAGGIERILLRLGAAAMDQRTTFVIDHIAEDLPDIFPSERRVFVQVTNDLSTQHP